MSTKLAKVFGMTNSPPYTPLFFLFCLLFVEMFYNFAWIFGYRKQIHVKYKL